MKIFFALSNPKRALTIAFLLISFISQAQLVFETGQYQVDKNLQLIICNRVPGKTDVEINTVTFDKLYTFSTPANNIQIGQPYEVASDGVVYRLYFTQVPIASIQVSTTIQDNYQSATLTVADTIGDVVHSPMGIRLRGATSRTFPKKSYHIQLWVDATGAATQDRSLLGLREDQTWLLLAMYNEKLRLNNKLSHELWLKFHKLYYADLEPDAHSTIRTKYVEVFINGDYQGIYLLAEDTDRKQFKLKKQTSSEVGGELYKSEELTPETVFTSVSELPTTSTNVWQGWELDYPDATNWANLHQFINFVANQSDSLFKQQIATQIREDNLADYFIFLNLIRATDNFGKNIFLARYNQGQPYFIAPWDLDGTWGYLWEGSNTGSVNDILSNNLFNRLLTVSPDFRIRLATRWFSARATILSFDSLSNSINGYYNFLSKNGLYERENLKWSGPLLSYSSDELNYMQNWLQDRLNYLDTYFKNLVQDQPIIYQFAAQAAEQKAVLNWSANCLAINTFDVERSSDQLNWGSINGYSLLSDESHPCAYSYTDENPGSGIVYYRLKIVDLKNNVSYSTIQKLDFSPAEIPVRVYPNPVSTTLQVQGNVQQVDVYSTNGLFLYSSDLSSPSVVQVNQLPSGMYLVRVTQKSGLISTHKVLVSRD
ncbi:hypothetical protein GCM10027592_47460 [Spirosoma flavus]